MVTAGPDMGVIQLRWRKYPDTLQERRKVSFRTVYPIGEAGQKITLKKIGLLRSYSNYLSRNILLFYKG